MRRSRRPITTLAAVAAIAMLAACDPTGAPSVQPIPPDATQQLTSPVVSSAEPTPDRTPVPGFEDWQTINPQAVRITRDGDILTLRLVASVLWFEEQQGVLFHTEVTGDFRATATVRTAKDSDPEAPPGRDGTIQLAGLMARSEAPAENWVSIATGSLGPSTGVETRNTSSSQSVSTQTSTRGLGDADLRLCREGKTVRLAFRPAGSTDPWLPVATYDRPDLPATLQVGAGIDTDSAPDLVAMLDSLTIEPLAGGEAC